MLWKILIAVAATSLMLLAAGAALADPPSIAGRIAHTEGTVSFRAADQGDWQPATLNYPVTSGDAMTTGQNSRVGIQIGSTEIFLDGSSAIEVSKLDDGATDLRVEGAVFVYLPVQPPTGIQITTAHTTVVLTQAGRYRITAGYERTEVAVLEGAARVNGDTPLDLHAGQSVSVDDYGMGPIAAATRTPFDDWAFDRTRPPPAAQTAQYVSPQMTGYQDLDRAGSWNTVPSYGAVWFPQQVPTGWVPYRYGHWAFIPPWGWTWVDDAPWGFAPFHYGRWVVIEHRWAWWPGPGRHRPIYAPALVTFIGSPGWGSITVVRGARPIGWVPLAPHEHYRPHYRASPAYVRNINVVTINNTTINNAGASSVRARSVERFANRDAATVVSSSAFTRSAAVHRSQLALPREEIARAVPSNDIGRLRPQWKERAPAAASMDRAPAGAVQGQRLREDRPTRIERNAVRDVAPSAGRALSSPDRREERDDRRDGRPSAIVAPAVRAAEPERARQLPPRGETTRLPAQAAPTPQISLPPSAPVREQAERIQRQSQRQALPSPHVNPAPAAPVPKQAEKVHRQSVPQVTPSPQASPAPVAPTREQAERFSRQSPPEIGRDTERARNAPQRIEAPRATVVPQSVAPRPAPQPQAVVPAPQPQVMPPRTVSPREMHQPRAVERPTPAAPPIVHRAPVQQPQAIQRAPAPPPQAIQRAPAPQPQAVQRASQQAAPAQSGRQEHRGNGNKGGIAESLGVQKPNAMR
jgi:hypothetical protein